MNEVAVANAILVSEGFCWHCFKTLELIGVIEPDTEGVMSWSGCQECGRRFRLLGVGDGALIYERIPSMDFAGMPTLAVSRDVKLVMRDGHSVAVEDYQETHLPDDLAYIETAWLT